MNKSGTFNIILVASFLLSNLSVPLTTQSKLTGTNFSINFNHIMEKFSLWTEGLRVLTFEQGTQKPEEITGTAIAIPSLDNPATEIPTKMPTETATMGETYPPSEETPVPSVEPTLTPELTSTSTALPTDTVEPTPTESPVMTTTFDLFSSVEYLTVGDPFKVSWRLTPGNDLIQIGPIDREILELQVPNGLVPLNASQNDFDNETGILRMHLALEGEIVWQLKPEADVDIDTVVHLAARIITRDGIFLETGLDFAVAETFQVAPNGGQGSTRSGKIKVSIPDNALSENAKILVRRPKPGSIPYSLSGHPIDIIVLGEVSKQEIHAFSKKIEIEIHYEDEDIKGDETTLTLFYYDEVLQYWVPLPSRVDIVNNVLTAWSDHLTPLDINTQDWEAARLPSIANFQVSEFTGAATYALPIEVPAGPGGLQPSLSLSYNSQVVDSASSITQASWVGIGWSLDVPYIRRNMHGTPNNFGSAFEGQPTRDYDYHGDKIYAGYWIGSDGDDTFTLHVNGMDYLLLRVWDTDDDMNTIEYRTADESFMRIIRYHGHNGADDASYWMVWDKTGNSYFFDERAYYTTYEVGGCNVPFRQTWEWGISTFQNIYGKELTYTYDRDNYLKNAAGCSYGVAAWTDTAIYPKTILYPNGRYKVEFELTSRNDYGGGWTNWNTMIFFEARRLQNIVIWHDSNGDQIFDEIIRKYTLVYTDGTIFPNVYWNNNTSFKTPTLTGIREYGLGGSNLLPETTFVYADGMHLTDATNGYGGSITFEYNIWSEIAGPDEERLLNLATGAGIPVGNFTGRYYTEPHLYEVFRPGQGYRINFYAAYSAPGELKLGIKDGNNIVYATNVTYTLKPGYSDVYNFYATIYLPETSPSNTERHFFFECGPNPCIPYQFQVHNVVTRHLVTTKSVQDAVLGDPASVYTYTYMGTATNDPQHSEGVNSPPSYSLVYTEFRGSEMVTVTDPTGLKTTTTYFQDDWRKGQINQIDVQDAENVFYSQTINSLEYSNLYENVGETYRLGPLPKTNYVNYGGLHIAWIKTTSSEFHNYDGGGSWIGTRNDYQYNTTDQGDAQYGNRTRTISSFWNTSAWVPYRASVTGYYPNVSNGTPENSRYLTGLPGYTNTYQCPGGCDWQTANLTSSLWYLYDGHTMYNIPPDSGKITGTRTLLRFMTPPATNPMYADTSYGYDDWGNRTSITQYSGEADSVSFGLGSGARTAYTCYGKQETLNGHLCNDNGYYTYPEWTRNSLDQLTTFVYDRALGVPTSLTDPNNATTTASYDTFGRILTIIRPGDDSNNPTMSMSYHAASAPFLNNPFWTEAKQRITGNTYFTIRKYYNGIGLQIQTQVVGAMIGTIPSDILTDTFYDAGGRVNQQSVPYDVATGSNYHTQNRSIAHTHTSYDVLGRPTSNLATDGSPTSYNYWVDYDNNYPFLYSKVTNPRGYETITQSDIWGRVVLVTPPTGPVVNYGYDAADHLISVVRGGSSTTLNYDFGGRKTSMSDPDMGTWSYTYDALGNLATQTDARGCLTNLSYDLLNRPTGKSFSGSCGVATTAVNYTYDSGTNGIGRRIGMSDGSGSTSWSYDPRGRMTQEIKAITGSGTFKTLWGYNSADMLSSMTYPADASGTSGEVVNYSYYPQMLLDSVMGTDNYVNNTDYDAAGRMELRDLGGSVGSPVIRQDYTYFDWLTGNGQGRLQQITGVKMNYPASVLQDLRYTYDALGNVLTIKDYKAGNPQTQTFTYDGLDRLTSGVASGGSGGTYALQNYSYDSTTGNLSGNAGLSYTYNTTSPSPAHGVRRSNGTGGSSKTIKIRAYSTPCNDGVRATMELWVNGSKVATWANISSNWTNYSQSATLSGKDVIDVVFTNDCFGGGYDRNLYVDYVIVDGTTIQAEGGAAILDRGDGTAAFDGQDVLMGQEAINWGGALRLVKGEGAFIGGYDGNGNLTSRVVNGAAYLLAYDAENHMVGVSGGASASFVYDGDGKRVKGTVAGANTAYIGSYFEWKSSTSDMIKYYYAGNTRVAMRTGSSTINYLLGDHLGSQAITTSSSGTLSAEIRYYPWGKDRYTYGTTPTTYKFTGQRQESSLGLYFYNSRWYDPMLGRFIQADTVVPGAGNSQAYDRYAYSYGNPVKYTDPSGHLSCSARYIAEGDCSDASLEDILQDVYGVILKKGNLGDFTQEEIRAIYLGIQSVDFKLRKTENKFVSGESFKENFGFTIFLKGNNGDNRLSSECMSISTGGCTSTANLINFVQMSGSSSGDLNRMQHNVVHELGHSYDISRGYGPRLDMPYYFYENRELILRPNEHEGRLDWQQNLTKNASETFADMFIAWTYDVWNLDVGNIDLVNDAQKWMNNWVP